MAKRNITSVDGMKMVKHDWHQTGSEVIITLYPGGSAKNITIKDLNVETNKTSCLVIFPGGEKYWTSEFFDVVLPEFTSIQQKSNKFIIKMMKNEPRNWDSLEPVIVEEKESIPIINEPIEIEPEKPVIELPLLKHDFYEKCAESLNLSIYVKSISKDTLTVCFEEAKFVVKFQTRDRQFLSNNKCTNEATFSWTINLKATIKPDLCRFQLNDTKLEVIFIKKIPNKWNGLEEVPPKIRVVEVPSSTWVSADTGTNNVSSNNSTDTTEEAIENSKEETQSLSAAKKEMQKPTCMVSPLSKNELSLQVRPGFTGLRNLGNTCFMNSVLQCLANTRELKDYFGEGSFQSDINVANPLGMNGQLAVAFAVLLKNLWLGEHPCYIPSKLKTLIGSKATQFSGFAQHDAQEFMAFFLDYLHEDLNRIKDKPYIEYTNMDNKPDEVVAEESWQNYKKRNDSIVVSLFQGQFKSKLLCPICKKVSITFDPFNYLALPLPKEHFIYNVYFFHKDPTNKPIQYQIKLSLESTGSELKRKLAAKTVVKEKNLRFFMVLREIHLKPLPDAITLSRLEMATKIFVFEVYDEKLVGEPVVELKVLQRLMLPPIKNCCSYCHKEKLPQEEKLKRCTKCLKVAYCNVSCQGSDWKYHKENCILMPVPVGLPFLVSLPKSQTTFAILSRKLEGFSSHFVNIFQPPVTAKAQSPSNRASVSSPSSSSNSCLPLLTPDNDPPPSLMFPVGPSSSAGTSCSKTCEENETEKAISELNLSDMKPDLPKQQSAGTPAVRIVIGQQDEGSRSKPQFHIKAVDMNGQPFKITEEDDYKEDDIKDDGNESVIKHGYTHLVMDWNNNNKLPNYVMVQAKDIDCDIDYSSSAPKIGDSSLDDCLQLFTEPEILESKDAWYCPNCKEHREATKQLSLWRLPPVLIVQLKRFSYGGMLHFREKLDKMIEFPIRGLDLSPYVCSPNESAPIYDLYAVVNHQGGILGGHYTSYGRCVDLKDTRRSEVDWRLFDDGYVSSVSESSIVSDAAYVLFYRRRNYQFCPYRTLKVTKENSGLVECKNKAQKQRENAFDLETKLATGGGGVAIPLGAGAGDRGALDSNIINYADQEKTSTIESPKDTDVNRLD